LNDFRPIFLVRCVYKMIFKVLINRLKRMLPQIINGSQSTLLKGKRLLNFTLVANEVVDERREKKGVVVVRMDYKKACD